MRRQPESRNGPQPSGLLKVHDKLKAPGFHQGITGARAALPQNCPRGKGMGSLTQDQAILGNPPTDHHRGGAKSLAGIKKRAGVIATGAVSELNAPDPRLRSS